MFLAMLQNFFFMASGSKSNSGFDIKYENSIYFLKFLSFNVSNTNLV